MNRQPLVLEFVSVLLAIVTILEPIINLGASWFDSGYISQTGYHVTSNGFIFPFMTNYDWVYIYLLISVIGKVSYKRVYTIISDRSNKAKVHSFFCHLLICSIMLLLLCLRINLYLAISVSKMLLIIVGCIGVNIMIAIAYDSLKYEWSWDVLWVVILFVITYTIVGPYLMGGFVGALEIFFLK